MPAGGPEQGRVSGREKAAQGTQGQEGPRHPAPPASLCCSWGGGLTPAWRSGCCGHWGALGLHDGLGGERGQHPPFLSAASESGVTGQS